MATLEERLAKLEKLNETVADGIPLQKSQQAELVRYHATLKQVLATSEQKVKAARDELAIIKTTAGATTEEIVRKQEILSHHQESYQFRLDKETEIQIALGKTATLRKQYADKYVEQLNEAKSLEELSATTREGQISSYSDLLKKGGQAFQGTMAGLGSGASEALTKGPELATLMFANMYLGMGEGIETFKSEFLKLPADMEGAATGLVNLTGKAGQERRDTLTYALDPSGMQRMGGEGERSADMFRRFGGTAADASTATVALTENTAKYRMAINQGDVATTSYVANQAMAFAKLGVTNASYAQAFDIATNVIGMSNVEAAAQMRSLQSVADSTGMTLSKVVSDFVTNAPDLSRYGDRASDSFAKLQANASATGVGVGKLSKAMIGLAGFDEANKAAQMFNSVFARTGVVMSTTSVMLAKPGEKLDYMIGKFRELNLDLSDSGVQYQIDAIASSIDGLSGADIRRQILNVDDIETQARALNQIPKGIGETTAVIERGMTAAALQKKSFSDLGLSASKMAESIRPGATAYSEIIEQMFAKPLELTKESITAYLGMAGAIETLNFGAGAIGGFMNALPEFISAAAAVPVIGPVVVAGVGAALGAAGGAAAGIAFGTPELASTDAPANNVEAARAGQQTETAAKQ